MSTDDPISKIELILSDVDGVLTDGGIIFDNNGIETKVFNVRDGLGVRLWQRAGYQFGILTARNSQIVKTRASELGVSIIRQGVANKLPAAKEMIRDAKLTPEQVCYIGDDLPDIAVMQHVGYAVTVNDACQEAKATANYITEKPGGKGAVRETVEMLLKAKQRWEEAVQKYTG